MPLCISSLAEFRFQYCNRLATDVHSLIADSNTNFTARVQRPGRLGVRSCLAGPARRGPERNAPNQLLGPR